MRRFIWLPLAGALLTGGAAVGAAAPGLVADATDTVTQLPARGVSLLEEVLADLVGEDVINQDQSDAIYSAFEERVEQERAEWQARRDELRAEFEARREEMRALVEQLRSFLEDDVITADEVAQLPEGRVRNAIEGLLVDGEITREQLRELRKLFGPGRGHGPGFGRGQAPGFGPGD